jgi:hypothetical protein
MRLLFCLEVAREVHSCSKTWWPHGHEHGRQGVRSFDVASMVVGAHQF